MPTNWICGAQANRLLCVGWCVPYVHHQPNSFFDLQTKASNVPIMRAQSCVTLKMSKWNSSSLFAPLFPAPLPNMWFQLCLQFSQFSHSVVSDSLPPHGLQHARSSCPSPTPGVYANSWPLSWWSHPTISFSSIPFSSYLQSFPASGSFPMSWFFRSGGPSIRVPASASVPPMNIQDWFSLGWTGLISLQSKGLSRVFSITTVQKHQFFSTKLSL